MRQLAAVMAELAVDPGDRTGRQHAAEHASDLAEWLARHGGQVPARSARAVAYTSIGMVATDVLAFIGAEPEPRHE